MTGKSQPVLLIVLTRLYRGEPRMRTLVSLFCRKLAPELAEELLMRDEFEDAEAEMWHFFHLFSSRRNKKLALQLLEELYAKSKRPDEALVEFESLIEDEQKQPSVPVPAHWLRRNGTIEPVVSL